MKIKDIVEAINEFHSNKYPNRRGWFVGKMSILPTSINVCKRFSFSIFYHLDNKNIPVINWDYTTICSSNDKDKVTEEVLKNLLCHIFNNFDKININETIQI